MVVLRGVKYFAYGSNMCAARLRARVLSCEFHSTARLEGFQFRYTRGDIHDGSGKCSVHPTGHPTDTVHGVVYEFPEPDLHVLDRIEGAGFGYARTLLEVRGAGGSLSVVAYLTEHSGIEHAFAPYDWYRDFVVHGAREHGLPQGYIGALDAPGVLADPDALRAAREQAVLHAGAVQGDRP